MITQTESEIRAKGLLSHLKQFGELTLQETSEPPKAYCETSKGIELKHGTRYELILNNQKLGVLDFYPEEMHYKGRIPISRNNQGVSLRLIYSERYRREDNHKVPFE